jgi:hypothetical protein
MSSNELKMDPKKVKSIKKWSSPKNIFEVRIFHGLTSFYRKFIRNFSKISAQMMDTINKRHKSFKWTEEAERRFNILKENISKKLILVLLDFGKSFQVRCDAS